MASTSTPVRVEDPAPRSKGQRRLRRLAFVVLTGGMGGLTAILGIYLYYAPSVPEFVSMADYRPKLGSKVYSADNQLIAEFAAERRVLVPYDKIPPLLFKAFMAAEDKRFEQHMGVDVIGVIKAVVDKVSHPDEKLRGASTITQQVAKSLLADQESYEAATERKFRRKIREAIVAMRLERALTKQEILYLYVSQIFLGHKAYGVQAAAEHYFRKNVWELSLAEMATLAGLPQRPSDYSPVSRPEAAQARRRYVLRRMQEDGHITAEQAQLAAEEQLTVYPREELYLQIAPYYAEQVRREVIDRYGEQALLEDGLEIYTAANLEHQHYADMAIFRGLHELDERQGFRGPLTRLTPAKRALFQLKYREHLGLEPGAELVPQKGQLYLAVVTAVDDKEQLVELDIAGRKGTLPLAGMRWARDPDPTEYIELHYLEDVRKAVKVGDVISVSPTSRQELARLRYASEIVNTLPKAKDKESDYELYKLEQEPIAQGALLSVDPRSGYVTAQVGGYDFTESSYNRAIQACREPGSAFKPIVYSAAIDKLDYTPSTLVDDKPIIFDDPENEVRWKPANAGLEFRGQLPLRTALKDSINTPAIRVAEAVGIDDIIKNAHALGITTKLKRELGTALGSSCTTLYDLMQVYVTLNQYGERRPLKFIRRIVDRHGNVLEDNTVPWDPTLDWASRLDRAYAHVTAPEERALDEQTAFIMISLLRNVVEEGTGIAASGTGHEVAGKTGTTNDAYDAWFMGFTKNMVTGVWIGHDKKERPLGAREQGGRTALPPWVDFTVNALRDYTGPKPVKIEQGTFEPPTGVVRVSIDPDTGLLARPDSARAVMEYYRAGTEPTELAPDRSTFNPDNVTPWDIDTPL